MSLRHLLLALLAPALVPVAVAGEADAAAATITAPELKRHVEVLASDALEGRGTGSAGEKKAAEYLIEGFRAAGLEPGGEDGTFLQPFQVPGEAKLQGTPALELRVGEWWRELTLRREFQPFGFSDSGQLEAPLVFAGYGVVDPARGYDDYAGLDVKGKAVLVLRHQPRPDQGARENAFFVTKAKNAKARGAAALIVVNDTLHQRGDQLAPFGAGEASEETRLPAFHVTRAVAESLFKTAGRDLAALQKQLDEQLRPSSFELPARVRLSVQIERTVLNPRNVIARLPGSDPALAKEIVVFGAHYDHLGRGHTGQSLDPEAQDEIHNGADDNASGTSALLELAQAMTAARPRRTIYFVAFSGEEMGLLGSAHFVKQPPVPLERIVSMINLDMIGRLNKDKLEVGGVGSSPGFPDLVKRVCEPHGLKLRLTKSGFGPSDHASFYGAGVPVLFFFTGLHAEYHRPNDDSPLIQAEGMERVTRAAFAAGLEIANADARPTYVAPPARRENRPRLGVMLDQEWEGTGAALSQVAEGGPAAAAGLQDGDVIVALGGQRIEASEDLLDALGEHKAGDEVEVVVLRGKEQLTFKVKLAGRQ